MACVVVLLCAGLPAHAQTPTCDGLGTEGKALAAKLLASQYPYDCCDDTIARCLGRKPVCRLVHRLAENICRRVADGQDEDKIVRGLSRRARSMMSGKKAPIDLRPEVAPVVGEPSAPVALVEYACARCPFCTKITPPLYQAIIEGQLKGKARLYFKVFPIRSHEYSKETGLGFMASIALEKFWPFMLLSYERFDHFCLKLQKDWATEAGMDPEAFGQLVADPNIRKLLVESKKEGLRNKVTETPTFYINGRKYFGDLDYAEVVDVLEEEYERVKGLDHLP
ncbi:MAG: thioredoxin domain-containing protein [Deltaproteobacteria bacterium]|nr:thioredoxin domain-containing protein [Deltaproteobacteria bacterium]